MDDIDNGFSLQAKELIREIIEQAEMTADNFYSSAIKSIEDDIGYMSDDQKRDYLQSIWKKYTFQLPLYDVRDKSSLLFQLGLVWSSTKIPYKKDTEGFPLFREDQSKEDTIHFILWNQFLILRKFKYLESRLRAEKMERPGISKTLTVMLVISSLFKYQCKYWLPDSHREILDPVVVIAPFRMCDFQSFHEEVISKGSNDPAIRSTLQKIYENAQKNLDIYKRKLKPVESVNNDHIKRGKRRIRIESDGSIRWVIQDNLDAVKDFDFELNQQSFTNDNLADYCSAIEDFLGQVFRETDKKNDQKPPLKVPEYKSLHDAFIEISLYREVMNSLKEMGYCSLDGTWQDQKKGSLSILASLIKRLAANGFCKKTRFSSLEIKSICLNTFKTNVSESTIKHSNPDFAYFLNIPPPPST